jgi:MinD-like ATPase involved in chromosome partitioning or flagellar assembly
MSERRLVPVPENALRDEPLAFGLTAAQLGLCGFAVVVGLVLNLVPLPEVIRFVLVIVGAGAVVVVAVLPIRGEPAYRWLVRYVRYRRGQRVWAAVLHEPDKSQLSDADEDGPGGAGPMDTEATPTAMPAPAPPNAAPGKPVGRPLGSVRASLRLVDDGPEPLDLLPPMLPAAQPRPGDVVPHVVAGLRVVVVMSFAGGVGRTTLAVEAASLVAARARYRTIEGEERRVGVLLLDASRLAPSAGLRLGLDPEALSRLSGWQDWTDPRAVGQAAASTRSGVDLVALPGCLPLDAIEGFAFGGTEAGAMLEGAELAGNQLVVADLGAPYEEGHRHLIDQASLVVGIVRPTLGSLPDVLRLASFVRTLGMGRKLVLVANGAADDRDVRRLADEVAVPLLATIPPLAAFELAAERGEPAWALDPTIESAIEPLASAVWPLVGARGSDAPHAGLAGALGRMLRRTGTAR